MHDYSPQRLNAYTTPSSAPEEIAPSRYALEKAGYLENKLARLNAESIANRQFAAKRRYAFAAAYLRGYLNATFKLVHVLKFKLSWGKHNHGAY